MHTNIPYHYHQEQHQRHSRHPHKGTINWAPLPSPSLPCLSLHSEHSCSRFSPLSLPVSPHLTAIPLIKRSAHLITSKPENLAYRYWGKATVTEWLWYIFALIKSASQWGKEWLGKIRKTAEIGHGNARRARFAETQWLGICNKTRLAERQWLRHYGFAETYRTVESNVGKLVKQVFAEQ